MMKTRTFFINDVEIPYHFNLFIYGDGYSTLTKKETVLEKMYWFVRGRFEEDLLDDTEDNDSLESINAQLASLGVREMDLTTVDEIISYVEGSIIDDLMVDELNKLLDDAEQCGIQISRVIQRQKNGFENKKLEKSLTARIMNGEAF